MTSTPITPTGLTNDASPTHVVTANSVTNRYGRRLLSDFAAGGLSYATVAELIAASEASRGVGAIWEADTFRYDEAPPAATDQHITTAGGVKLYVLPRDGVWPLAAFGPPSADNLPQHQKAYDAASALGEKVRIAGGPWSCSAPVTLTGTSRCRYEIEPGATFTTPTALANAIPELANATGHLAKSLEAQTVYFDGSGFAKLFSGEMHGTGTNAAGQRDFIRIEMEAHATNTGPSWDGVGAVNINRDQTAISAFAFCKPGNLYTSLWGGNFYAYFPGTSNGQGTGIEANIDLDVGVPAVKELGTFNKLGVSSVSKDQAATAAFAVGGLFYKGVVLTQSNLPNDAASRAFEFTNLFEVMRDGRTLVGKGISDLFTAGAEIGPDGTFYITGDAAPAQPFYARNDTLTGAAEIRSEQDRFLNSTGTQKVAAQKIVSVTDHNDGTEDTQVEWHTITAGTVAARMRLSTSLDALVPIHRAGTQVVNTRRTGWTAASGTATRTTFDTTTVTTAQLAERVKALLDDLIAHGLIGA